MITQFSAPCIPVTSSVNHKQKHLTYWPHRMLKCHFETTIQSFPVLIMFFCFNDYPPAFLSFSISYSKFEGQRLAPPLAKSRRLHYDGAARARLAAGPALVLTFLTKWSGAKRHKSSRVRAVGLVQFKIF